MKNNKIKEEKYRSEDQKEIIRFIKILLIVVILIVGIYFATRLFVKKDLIKSETETPVTEIDYTKMVFGTMLNRPYEEYYVFAFSKEDLKSTYYSALASKYLSKDKSLYVYYVDLDDSMNKEYIATEKSNPKATSVADLQVGDLTLIKVKNGKIVKYIEDINDIKLEWGLN